MVVGLGWVAIFCHNVGSLEFQNIRFATFCRQKVAQKPRKAKFVGSPLVVGKTDATHF